MIRPAGQDHPVQAADPDRANERGRKRRWRRKRDWGGILARLLCTLFAIIGVIPLGLGALARVDDVQQWAADQTSQVLDDQLGLDARYDLELRPWPLSLTLSNVVIEASDGGTPFLEARSIIARPRIFSLLAGKPDLGELDMEDAVVRAVIQDGALTNLAYRLPESEPSSEPADLPLSAVSLTNATVDVTIDDVRLRSAAIDVDISVGRPHADQEPLLPAGVLEVSLRTGRTLVDRLHPTPAGDGLEMLDEDVICGLDLRARLADDVVVRRFEVRGALDADPAPGTRPSCELPGGDWRRLAVSLEGSQVRFLPGGELEGIDGRIAARIPVGVAHRFVDLAPVTGWVELDLERAHYDPRNRLPDVEGTLRAADLGIDTKVIGRRVEASLRIENDRLEVSDLKVAWAGGMAHLPRVELEPFAEGMPLMAHDVRIEGVTMEDLLDDLAAHPRAHVGWLLELSTLRHFGGTLMPLDLSGPIEVRTRDFAVWDEPTTSATKQRLMGVSSGNVTGTFQVTPEAIVLNNMTLVTPRSRVRTTVSLGYDEQLGVVVYEGSKVDFRDVSPLVGIEMAGVAEVTAEGQGEFSEPTIQGEVAIDDFVFGGFRIGDVGAAKVAFAPLELMVTEARVAKGQSDVDVPQMRIAFDDGDAAVVVQGTIDTRRGGMILSDLFRMMNLLPDQARAEGAPPTMDPTWENLRGKARGVAQFDYVLGGRRDRCDSGRLAVNAHLDVNDVSLYDVAFDDGEVDFDWRWDDMDAGAEGLTIDLHSAVLRKGAGTVMAKATVRDGAALHADVIGTAIPIDEFRQFQSAFGKSESDDDAVRRIRPEANVSFVGAVNGTLSRIEGKVDVEVSPMRIGPDLLPSSSLEIAIIPDRDDDQPVRVTRCNNPVYPPFDPRAWTADGSDGVFSMSGQLFAGQIRFDDIQITRQRASMVSGKLQLDRLDLGALANLLPDVAFSAAPPKGHLTAEVHIDEIPMNEPGLSEIRLFVKEAVVERRRARVRIGNVREPILLSGDALRVPTLPLDLELGSGLKARLMGGGTVEHLSRDPELSLAAQLAPVDLGKLGVDIPSVNRASGVVKAGLALAGPLASPQLSGRLELDDGMLRVEGLPVGFDDIGLDLRIEEGEISIRRATARIGNTGRVSVSGRIPLRGMEIATADATLVATDVNIPVADGVKLTADARLHATYVPSRDGSQRTLPNITGRVTLKQFSYTRPISFRLDLDALTGGGRTQVESYNPDDDTMSFDVAIVSPRPVTISNNLLDMRLDLGAAGVRLSGTDQRFGAQGQLRLVPGSKLFLQGHDFVVRNGTVSFDNPTRIAPRLDVTATTEYRRYAASSPGATAVSSTAADAAAAGSASGGRWRITMHAYGDTDAPEVRFTSDPPLSQEDIVLLLQVGMTRAELDRNLSGALAQTVGLEALNAVTGLDQAFRKTVPIIDEFRVGTQYSSRTGRPEPSVTLGKRITDDVRASVTTGLSENREVQSNVEWRLKGGVSVQGSYDNVNDVANAGIGNIGAGLRWRLEFE